MILNHFSTVPQFNRYRAMLNLIRGLIEAGAAARHGNNFTMWDVLTADSISIL